MMKRKINNAVPILLLMVGLSACVKSPLMRKDADRSIPESYGKIDSSRTSADLSWRSFFKDPFLQQLIDSALANNQELNIVMQEIEMLKNEAAGQKGEYLPQINLGVGGGIDRAGRFTRNGALEANTDIEPGRPFPEPFSDSYLGANARWEVDVWKKLRNARKSTIMRYLASQAGRNFMVTELVAEIANAYYDLLALDNELAIVESNIQLQSDALQTVKMQKRSARVTELAVRRFDAQLLKTKSMRYEILQEIIETENRINFLVGRFPQQVQRSRTPFIETEVLSVNSGSPADLLDRRPDIQEAEQMLQASKLDVKVAKANFYPSLGLTAGVGMNAFRPSFLLSPESIVFDLAGDLTAPLINRKAIKANYYNANARQVQAIIDFEQTILNAYIEVLNGVRRIDNLEEQYTLQNEQVETLTKSVEISNDLFTSARADYMEVLLTQREALESRFELVETKKKQFNAAIEVYQALGGGWN